MCSVGGRRALAKGSGRGSTGYVRGTKDDGRGPALYVIGMSASGVVCEHGIPR